jgi:hypothetical protein
VKRPKYSNNIDFFLSITHGNYKTKFDTEIDSKNQGIPALYTLENGNSYVTAWLKESRDVIYAKISLYGANITSEFNLILIMDDFCYFFTIDDGQSLVTAWKFDSVIHFRGFTSR